MTIERNAMTLEFMVRCYDCSKEFETDDGTECPDCKSPDVSLISWKKGGFLN